MSAHCKFCGEVIEDPDTGQMMGYDCPDGTWYCNQRPCMEKYTNELMEQHLLTNQKLRELGIL